MTDLSTRPVRSTETPRLIRMHGSDNVAIVANDAGLAAGTRIDGGVTLRERVPQGHKVALADIAEGAPVRRYNVAIGFAKEPLPAGSWVNEQRLVMPTAPALKDLPIATDNAPLAPALEGYTFEGFRNPDGSVGTRNILGITTTVQCVSGVVEHAVRRIRAELLPQYPNVDDVVPLEHIYGCGVAIDAPDAVIPIRTFGPQRRIFMVHFRNIQGGYLDFREAMPDEGSVDMPACIRAYREVGYDGILCPDHVPFSDVDPNRERFFSFCLGYTKALLEVA